MPKMNGKVVIVGAGTAGMEAAGHLARAGCKVTLVEKESKTGGHIKSWFHLFPDRRDSAEVIEYLEKQIDHSNITLLNDTCMKAEKKHGSFIIRTKKGIDLDADAVLISTGFDLFRSERKEEYGYGIYDNVIT